MLITFFKTQLWVTFTIINVHCISTEGQLNIQKYFKVLTIKVIIFVFVNGGFVYIYV